MDAVTDFERVAVYGRYSIVVARPRTGRLHQIRRHLKHISHPLIGDVRYGKGPHNRRFRDNYGLHRLALHAQTLSLTHPASGEQLTIHSPVPATLLAPLLALAAEHGDEGLAQRLTVLMNDGL